MSLHPSFSLPLLQQQIRCPGSAVLKGNYLQSQGAKWNVLLHQIRPNNGHRHFQIVIKHSTPQGRVCRLNTSQSKLLYRVKLPNQNQDQAVASERGWQTLLSGPTRSRQEINTPQQPQDSQQLCVRNGFQE